MSTTTTSAEPRITGPYEHRPGEWRCRITREGKREWGPIADSPQRAKRLAEATLERYRALRPETVEVMLERYAEYMTAKGNKPRSIVTSTYRLRSFFRDPHLPVGRLNEKLCSTYYTELMDRQKADTHRNALAEARTFVRWLMKRGLIESDPLGKIEPMGRRKKGKPQLHLDEARRWLSVAEKLAREGQDGAVAAMVTLLMSLRATEIIERVVRDLDDGGKLLWIPSSKTEAGRRRVEVPEVLRPYLLKLKRSKLPTAKLFGDHWRDWPRRWVEKICKLSGVPKVNAHSMRGLFATLGIQAGAAPHVVAATLGHESPTVTLSNYAQPGSAEIAPAHRAVAALTER